MRSGKYKFYVAYTLQYLCISFLSSFVKEDSTIFLNTSNLGKLKEYQEYFSPKIVIAELRDLAEPKADSLTIIRYKASQFEGVLVDDVSLDVEGLDIGVNIRWFLKELNNPKYHGRCCKYTCLLGVNENNEIKIYRGVSEGVLVESRGSCFGFGSYFLPNEATQTLGEFMEPKYNARYLAIQNFKENKPFAIFPPLLEWNGEFQ